MDRQDYRDRMKDMGSAPISDEESLKERIATMLDELPADKLDRIISDHVDYEAFVSSQRAMLIAYYRWINAKVGSDKESHAEFDLLIFTKATNTILLNAVVKACKDK